MHALSCMPYNFLVKFLSVATSMMAYIIMQNKDRNAYCIEDGWNFVCVCVGGGGDLNSKLLNFR